MNDISASHLVQPVIKVRAGQDPDQPHRGTLTIGNWTIPCAVGRSGLRDPALKREGDGATPIGTFPLRYGFYDPEALGDEPRSFAFPFLEKPANYNWVEDPESPFYNQFVLDMSPEALIRTGERLFDLFIPVGWNDSTPRAAGGSAIFMHAARPDFSGTQGCVAIAHDQLLEFASRLQPGMMIDIAPADAPEQAALPVQTETMECVSFRSLQPGPSLIVTGSVHGNETCGPTAIARVIAEFRSGRLRLARGSVTFVPVVNALAYRWNRREGDRNLNRDLGEKPVPVDNEDRIANVLCPLLREHDVLIDLHSFSSPGVPFALIGPADNNGTLEPFAKAAEEEALVKALGLPMVVHGWMDAFKQAATVRAERGFPEISLTHSVGTTEYMRFAGGYGVTVECGTHTDPQGAAVGYRTILNGLAHLGLVVADPILPKDAPQVWEISEALMADAAEDRLSRRFAAGEAVREGEVIGQRASGQPIRAPYDGAIIFASLTAEPGTELCFFCRPSDRLKG